MVFMLFVCFKELYPKKNRGNYKFTQDKEKVIEEEKLAQQRECESGERRLQKSKRVKGVSTANVVIDSAYIAKKYLFLNICLKQFYFANKDL